MVYPPAQNFGYGGYFSPLLGCVNISAYRGSKEVVLHGAGGGGGGVSGKQPTVASKSGTRFKPQMLALEPVQVSRGSCWATTFWWVLTIAGSSGAHRCCWSDLRAGVTSANTCPKNQKKNLTPTNTFPVRLVQLSATICTDWHCTSHVRTQNLLFLQCQRFILLPLSTNLWNPKCTSLWDRSFARNLWSDKITDGCARESKRLPKLLWVMLPLHHRSDGCFGCL